MFCGFCVLCRRRHKTHFNDRLLLRLKGTMSEAELHILHSSRFYQLRRIINSIRRDVFVPASCVTS
ncbi:MAG: hypothetical protein DMF97_11740 [Acidobacteria bacterium]|nr:MAG: hypothetical protein DMF97_11740 [Acidobacteriota bacterium]